MSRIRRLLQFFTGGASSATGRVVNLAAVDRSVVALSAADRSAVALPGVDRSAVTMPASAQG